MHFFCRVFALEVGNGSSYCVVTQDGQCHVLELWSQRSVSFNGKVYIPYTGVFDDGSHVDNIIFLRQDGMKFFLYETEEETEHLMFDFGLQKGDMFTDSFSGSTYEVEDIRDTIINEYSRQLIELHSLNNESLHDVWMIGIGSIYTGIIPCNNYFKHAYMLVCEGISFSINNQFVKTGNMKAKSLSWERKIETDEDWEEYYNWCNAPSDLIAEFVGDTLCVRGRLHTSCELQTFVACVLNGSHVTFRFFSAADVDCITNYNIDARIPGFQRGIYQIKLLNKTVELENTGSIYTSVDRVNASPVLNINVIYDLQGRQLSQTPQKGMYIQNGKRVAVK